MYYKILIISSFLLAGLCSTLKAQPKTDTFSYELLSYDSDQTEKRVTYVECYNGKSMVWTPSDIENPIPGYCNEYTFVDSDNDSIYYQYCFSDSTYYTVSPYIRDDIKWDTQIIDSKTTRYITNINSNRIELLFKKGKNTLYVNPLPYYGKFEGVMQEMVRNGLVMMRLSKSDKSSLTKKHFFPSGHEMGIRKTGREVSNIKRNRMILTTHVFENEQICWGKEKPSLKWEIPFDTTLHYAGGTLIIKRLNLPVLPSHYQTFVELRQRSNGDAYDRTGSVFVIPNANREMTPSFLDGVMFHPDSLPYVVGKDGQHYQGIVPGKSPMYRYSHCGQSTSYSPPVELMRFFTSFGVGHFNDRVKLDGLEWEDENFYKQEVTELMPLLEGDVVIGVFIGNYDGGGHVVSLDIKSYPNSYEWLDDERPELVDGERRSVVPLVNTCNVLEMAGQNYGKIFGTDSINVEFEILSIDSSVTLRYISTGHGGWGGGDEFNPKENEIFIDGVKRFSHTPWRCDCARYREWNPVSGNFWNGISSSDLSRSGWCPGTATQPVYFDISDLKPGKHTLTIAIPQGKPMEGGFSHWNVSAALIKK